MGHHTRPMALLNTHPPERWFRPRRVADRSRCVRYFIRHFLVRGLAIHNLYFSYLSPYESVPRPLGHGRVRRSTSRRARRVRLPFGRSRAVIPHDTTSFRTPTPPQNARQTTMGRTGVRSLPHAVGSRIPGGDVSVRRRVVRGPRSGGAFASADYSARARTVARRASSLTRSPPSPSTSQEAVFPEALKSLKEADPDVYALVQKEKLRQMCVPPRADAIDPDAPALSDRRLFPMIFPARGRERPPSAMLNPLSFPLRIVSSSRAARATSSSRPRTSPRRP